MVDAAMLDAPGCPMDYVSFGLLGASAYRTVVVATPWLAAQADCANDGVGTHLVVIDNITENMTVDALTGASVTWIGFSDRITEGTFRAVTGAVVGFTNWGAGNPDGAAAQNCVALYSGTLWGDGDCAYAMPAYVCECDGVPSDPAAF
ncbi:MAG: C-type lectin domain-containing protein [Kofleriaceae bacterium]